MSNSEWRPKVGERVMVTGNTAPDNIGRTGIVIEDDGGDYCPIQLQYDDRSIELFQYEDLSPLPAPHKPWDVLREAHKLMLQAWPGSWYGDILDLATKLEAAATPKPPPTLAEAVRAYSEKLNSGASEVGAEYAAMMAALARAEAENKQ